MTGTRSSARLSTNGTSSSPPSKSEGNNKRKADSSPASSKSKRGKQSEPKEQKTIEETLGGDLEKDKPEDIEMKEAGSGGEGQHAEPNPAEDTPLVATHDSAGEDGFQRGPGCWFWLDSATYDHKGEKGTAKGATDKIGQAGEAFKGKNKHGESKDDPEKALKDSRGGPGLNAGTPKEEPKDESKEEPKTEPSQDDPHTEQGTSPDQEKPDTSNDKNGSAVQESKERADAQPSNILEKGVIYFFTRNRVNIDDAESVQDLQRSYFVLRPIPEGAKLGDGAVKDLKNNRLIALPKKVWPKSGKDRFMVFVEKTQTTLADLKENFFSGSEYETQTTGTSHQSPVTLLGEGVYAITSTSSKSEAHLAYMLTIPKEPGELQEDVGIRSKGAFVMSLKNPSVKGPANATLSQPAEFPKDVMDAFRGRGWMPAEPKHLDYVNAQVLLIGEDIDSSHALEATKKDQENDAKETPAEEMDKLEHEDEIRVSHLKGDDTVFADLGLSKSEYEGVSTTW